MRLYAEGDHEQAMAYCIQKMAKHNFSWQKRTNTVIWASKDHECPDCKAPAFSPCVNLVDVRRNIDPPRQNRQPHDRRINWVRIANTMIRRGIR